MRRVSVLMEVDENTYETIVEPRKKAKTFAKLMGALLEGYKNDGYIQAFVDGVLADMKKSTSSSLDKVIADMHVSLANLGLYTDDLKANAQSGKEMFSEKVDEVNTSYGGDAKYSMLEELMREVLEQNKEILGFLHSGIPINNDAKEKIVEASSGIMEGVSEVGESVFETSSPSIFEPFDNISQRESASTSEVIDEYDDDLNVGQEVVDDVPDEDDDGGITDIAALMEDLEAGLDDDEGLEEVYNEESSEASFDKDRGQRAAENYADDIMSNLLSGNMMTM